MPIVNLDNPISNPTLIISPANSAMTVRTDVVSANGIYSTHTINTDVSIDLLKIGQVIKVNGSNGEITSLSSDHLTNTWVITANFDSSVILPFTPSAQIMQYTFKQFIPTFQANTDSITYMVQNNLGLYLYLDYAKGSETDVRMYFTLRDSKQVSLGIPSIEYALMTVTDPTGLTVPYNLQVNSSGRYMMPVNIPEPAKYLTVNFAYTGSTSAAGGSLKVFANTDRNYYA